MVSDRLRCVVRSTIILAVIITFACRAKSPPRGMDREIVLCIGDSFTDGAGPDGAASCYPAALSAQLEQAAPGRFVVVQRSYPGGDSRRLLLDLPAVLSHVSPAMTYVLVGVNDAYSMPDPVADDELNTAGTELDRTGAAVLRCYVGGVETAIPGLSVVDPRWNRDAVAAAEALERSAGPGVGGEPRPESDDGPTGVWHLAAETIEFAPDGRLITRFGLFGWSVASGRLAVNGNGIAYEFALRRDGSRLHLSRPDGTLVIALEAGPAESRAVESDIEERRAEFEAAGNWISALWLARAEAAAGKVEDAAEHCTWILARSAFNYPALELLQRLARREETRARALTGISRAAEKLAADDETRSAIERLDAVFRSPDDPLGCAERVVRAHTMDRDRRATIRSFRNDSTIHDEHVEAAIRTLAVDPSISSEVRAAFAAVPGLDESLVRVLRGHLLQIAAKCRERGGDVAILTYPRLPESLAPAFAGLSDAGGPRLIEVHRVLAELPVEERARLVVLDGHGTALGYARVAELVAADLLANRIPKR